MNLTRTDILFFKNVSNIPNLIFDCYVTSGHIKILLNSRLSNYQGNTYTYIRTVVVGTVGF